MPAAKWAEAGYTFSPASTPRDNCICAPACVVTCPAECRIFGDMDDDQSPPRRYLEARGPASVLRPDAETGAHVFYVEPGPT